jgi:hypothetical protein
VLDPKNTVGLSIWGNQVDNAVASDTLEKLLARIRKDPKYVELYRFVRACLNPTPQILEAYEAWSQTPWSHSGSGLVPPSIVGECLGMSKSKVSRLQDRLAVMFFELGYSVHQIFGRAHCKKQTDEWFVNCWGVTRQEDLRNSAISLRP